VKDFFETLEQQYETLLSESHFQKTYADYLNFYFEHQALPYEGLLRETIAQKNNKRLYRYVPLDKKKCRGTVFIVYAFINRPSILDLHENRSFIKKLLEQHLEVYLLDWGNPLAEDKHLGFEEYLNILHDFIPKKITLLGVCEGGVLSACYAACFPKKINKLITMVTPIDFRHSLLSGFLKNVDTTHFQENISGKFLSAGLQSLKPFRFLKLEKVDLPFFLCIEKWINDCPDHPAKFFREFVYHCYQRNDLARGQFLINKKRIDLSKLTLHILNIYATKDHLVPPHAAKILGEITGSLHYKALEFNGGHISVFVNQKALEQIPAAIAAFV
jgi:polyhydroxyalkanoate synthase